MASIMTKVGIEENGKEIVPAGLFDEIAPIILDNGEKSDKFFQVKQGDDGYLILIDSKYELGYIKYGPIDKLASINENCIVTSCYDERHGEKWELIESDTFNLISKRMYDLITPINENMYVTKVDGLYGVIDKDGNDIISNTFAEISFESAYNTFQVKLYSEAE